MSNIYKNKGRKIFYWVQGDMHVNTISREELPLDFDQEIYSLFTGEEFYQMVKNGVINDEDGTLCEVYFDGYLSNLDLQISRGGFGFNSDTVAVDSTTWLNFCKNHEILVNWANK